MGRSRASRVGAGELFPRRSPPAPAEDRALTGQSPEGEARAVSECYPRNHARAGPTDAAGSRNGPAPLRRGIARPPYAQVMKMRDDEAGPLEGPTGEAGGLKSVFRAPTASPPSLVAVSRLRSPESMALRPRAQETELETEPRPREKATHKRKSGQGAPARRCP